MAFSGRKKLRRDMSDTSCEFEFLNRASPEMVGGCEGVGREDSVGGDVERSCEFEVLQEGYLNMSVRVEEEEEDGSGTMARTLRSLRSNGSFSRVSLSLSHTHTHAHTNTLPPSIHLVCVCVCVCVYVCIGWEM